MSRKNETKTRKPLSLAAVRRGMRVKNWEKRENSDGQVVLYVRYIPKAD